MPDARMDRSRYNAADQILASLEAFEPEHWGLPAFDSNGSAPAAAGSGAGASPTTPQLVAA